MGSAPSAAQLRAPWAELVSCWTADTVRRLWTRLQRLSRSLAVSPAVLAAALGLQADDPLVQPLFDALGCAPRCFPGVALVGVLAAVVPVRGASPVKRYRLVLELNAGGDAATSVQAACVGWRALVGGRGPAPQTLPELLPFLEAAGRQPLTMQAARARVGPSVRATVARRLRRWRAAARLQRAERRRQRRQQLAARRQFQQGRHAGGALYAGGGVVVAQLLSRRMSCVAASRDLVAAASAPDVFWWAEGDAQPAAVRLRARAKAPARRERVGRGVSGVACGARHVAALCGASALVWGSAALGAAAGLTPTPSPVRRVAEVACGAHFCVARTAAGAVFTWGANDAGQLGVPTAPESRLLDAHLAGSAVPVAPLSAPQRVEGLHKVRHVAAGGSRAWAVVRTDVYGWGGGQWRPALHEAWSRVRPALLACSADGATVAGVGPHQRVCGQRVLSGSVGQQAQAPGSLRIVRPQLSAARLEELREGDSHAFERGRVAGTAVLLRAAWRSGPYFACYGSNGKQLRVIECALGALVPRGRWAARPRVEHIEMVGTHHMSPGSVRRAREQLVAAAEAAGPGGNGATCVLAVLPGSLSWDEAAEVLAPLPEGVVGVPVLVGLAGPSVASVASVELVRGDCPLPALVRAAREAGAALVVVAGFHGPGIDGAVVIAEEPPADMGAARVELPEDVVGGDLYVEAERVDRLSGVCVVGVAAGARRVAAVGEDGLVRLHPPSAAVVVPTEPVVGVAWRGEELVWVSRGSAP